MFLELHQIIITIIKEFFTQFNTQMSSIWPEYVLPGDITIDFVVFSDTPMFSLSLEAILTYIILIVAWLLIIKLTVKLFKWLFNLFRFGGVKI